MRRAAGLVIALLCATVLSGPARAQDAAARQAEALRDARARLTFGDTLGALAAVRDVQERDGNTAALETIRLTAERTGAGLRRYPPPARRRLVARTARRLLALDPASPLALETLADDAVATVLFYRDRGAVLGLTTRRTPAEANPRLRGSRFDLAQRAAARPILDRTAPGRDAARSAANLLDSLARVDPARAVPYLVALSAADERWGRLDSLDLGTSPAAHLARGLAVWRLGRAADAERLFDVALADLSPAERARFEDVSALLPSDSLDALRADPAGVASRFWAREDPRRLTPASERRTEHVARVLEADALFGRPLPDLFSDHPRRGAETDRGRIWVRYGRPDREAGLTPDAAQPAYERDEGAAFVVWEYDALEDGTRFVFDDAARSGRYRTYSPPATAYATPSGRASADDTVTQDRELQRTAPQAFTDTTARRLPLVVARFRDDAGRTEAVVALGTPGDGRAAVFVGEERRAETSVATVAIPENGATVRAEWLSTSQFGAAEQTAEPLAPGFGLSDLLIVGGTGPGVERRGTRLAPLVADTLVRARIDVYAEVYGLTLSRSRTDAEAEIGLVPSDTRSGVGRAVGRLFGRGQPRGVSTAVDVSGDAPTDAVQMSLDASRLPAGRYRLVLRLTDRPSGQTAETEREIVLAE